MTLADGIPAVTGCEMREVDQVVMDEYGITLAQMMENAGRALAQVAVARFDPRSAVVLAGPGGNGGGGLVAARHLSNRGIDVTVVLERDLLAEAPAQQLRILRHLPVTITSHPPTSGTDLVIDALIGYGLSGDPRGRTGELIDWANSGNHPVLALDAPSGLDPTFGLPSHPCITATATLTLALPKTGLLLAAEVGELYLADIGIPPDVYTRFGLHAGGVFTRTDIVAVPTKRHSVPRLSRAHQDGP